MQTTVPITVHQKIVNCFELVFHRAVFGVLQQHFFLQILEQPLGLFMYSLQVPFPACHGREHMLHPLQDIPEARAQRRMTPLVLGSSPLHPSPKQETQRIEGG